MKRSPKFITVYKTSTLPPGYTYDNANRDKPDWVTLSEFNTSYYSGLDVSIYFNGIYIEEIIQFNYQEMEKLRPNYSYADYVYRSVTHGSRLIQGSFVVNFKAAEYINKLIQELKNPGSIENVISKINQQELSHQKADMSKAIAGSDITLTDLLARNGDMKSMMDSLDEALWSTKRRKIPENSKKKYTPRYETNYDGFDIMIKYGQPEDNLFAETGDIPKEVDRHWGTVKVLEGCHLSGVSESIDDSGRNILETYTFTAKLVS